MSATITGGDAPGDDLNLVSTSDSTKGSVNSDSRFEAPQIDAGTISGDVRTLFRGRADAVDADADIFASVTLQNLTTGASDSVFEEAFALQTMVSGSLADTWALQQDPEHLRKEHLVLKYRGQDVVLFGRAAPTNAVIPSNQLDVIISGGNLLLDTALGRSLQAFNAAGSQVANVARVATYNGHADSIILGHVGVVSLLALFDGSGYPIVAKGGQLGILGLIADPAAKLHVQEPTLGAEVFRLESVATNDDVGSLSFKVEAQRQVRLLQRS